MKIRNGFVSNSSSSSFIIVSSPEIHEKVLSEINDDLVRTVINGVSSNDVAFGKDVIVVRIGQGDYEWIELPDTFDRENYKGKYELSDDKDEDSEVLVMAQEDYSFLICEKYKKEIFTIYVED